MRARTEDKLHVAVWRYLKVALPPDALAWSMENRGNGEWEGALRKARGVIAGIPDMQIIWRGRVCLIELKAPKGVVSADQKKMHIRIFQAGAEVHVCKSIEQVQHALTFFGIPLQAKASA